MIKKWTLKISNESFESEYSNQAFSNDSIGILCITLYSTVTLIFNTFLCLMLIDYSFSWMHGVQLCSLVALFILYCKLHSSQRFITVCKPVTLLIFCLSIEEHELDPGSVFYSSLFKTALFLMTAG